MKCRETEISSNRRAYALVYCAECIASVNRARIGASRKMEHASIHSQMPASKTCRISTPQTTSQRRHSGASSTPYSMFHRQIILAVNSEAGFIVSWNS
jgi:hypothetical protein